MIRRSFRIGLWVGLLAGIGVALSKIFRPKPEPLSVPTAPHEWPPLQERATPAPPSVAAQPVAPAAPAAQTEAAPKPEPEPQRVEQAAKKPAEKKPAPKKTSPTWIDPDGNICPDSHPVKGKLSSMIFQVPGNFAYDRTKPDRCYKTADDASNDGMRPAKR